MLSTENHAIRRLSFSLRQLFVMISVLAVVFAIVFVWKPWLTKQDRQYLRSAKQLDTADVAYDVNTAYEQGDYRFCAIMEEGLFVPSVDDVTKWDNVRVISGTSDDIESSAHGRFCDSAQNYARRYNQRMLAVLRANPPAAQ